MFINKSISAVILVLSLGLLSTRAQTTVIFNDDSTIAIATSTVLGETYDGEGATPVSFDSSAAITSTSLGLDGDDDNFITSTVSPFAEGTTTADAIGSLVTSSFDEPIASTSGKHKHDTYKEEQI